MKDRVGRLNITQFHEQSVRKIGVVKEGKRPRRLLVEKWAIEITRKLGANTPEILDYLENERGEEILVLKRIGGNNIQRLSLNEKCECLFTVGRQMRALKCGFNGFGWIDINSGCGTSKNWKSFLYSYARIYGNAIFKQGIISHADFHLILKRLSFLKIDSQVPFLVNRDIKPGNIIKDAEEVVWIIDWENVIIGDPLYDIAVFESNYGHGRLWKSLFNGYGISFSPPKYHVYLAVALFGALDFCNKNGISFVQKQKRLNRVIKELKNHRQTK